MKIRRFLIATVFCLSALHQAHADVIFTGDLAGGTGALAITSNINFTVDQAGDLDLVVFQGWAADLGVTGTISSNPFNASIAIEVNGASDTLLFNYFSFGGYQNEDMTFADGWIRGILGPSVVVGDVVTLLSQEINLQATSLISSGTVFVGDAFGSTSFGLSLTSSEAVSSVPEPGTLALLGLGLVGMAARRKKKV